MVYVESAERGRQIVSAARSVITRDGVAGATIRAVAKEAGIPLGTLQYVFPTKQDLMRAVIEDLIEDVVGVLRPTATLDGGLQNTLADGVRRFWDDLVIGDVPMQLAQFELTTYALRTEGLEDMARRQYEGYTDAVAEWLQGSAARAGEDSSTATRQFARLVVAAVDGLVLQYVVDPDPDRGRADIEALIGMLFGHVGARPAAGG